MYNIDHNQRLYVKMNRICKSMDSETSYECS